MNSFRRRLVDEAFNIFDTNASGKVDIYDIRTEFDPAGLDRQSDYEAYKDFLVNFGDKNGDGWVTRAEFHAYYEGISSYIDSDRHFELMMRNAWHISGGQGQSANTSNLRLLVTFEDGSQEEVALE